MRIERGAIVLDLVGNLLDLPRKPAGQRLRRLGAGGDRVDLGVEVVAEMQRQSCRLHAVAEKTAERFDEPGERSGHQGPAVVQQVVWRPEQCEMTGAVEHADELLQILWQARR
jgi:hypothetical protein